MAAEETDNPLPEGVTHEQALEFASARFPGTLMDKIGLEFVEIGTKRLRARIPVEGNVQIYGLLHGGATAALCETIGSYGTAVVAGLDKIVSGIELNINHLRAVREGWVTATAVPLHVGRTTAVWDMKIHDDQDRLVAAGRLTVAIRDART